jgi:hypothetical protein
MLKLDWKRHELRDPGVLQWGTVGRWSYSPISENSSYSPIQTFAPSTICQLQVACPDLGTRIAVTSSIFIDLDFYHILRKIARRVFLDHF